MRRIAFLGIFLITCSRALCQTKVTSPAAPAQFEIGRRTFFDVGPPFNYYDLFIVRATPRGTSIERISLTPPGNSCAQSAKVDVTSASSPESISAILGKTNPCTIPEKELHRELKRCKKCLVFSGANVAMQVQCGSQARIIRSDILDRDMFDPAADTPEHTEWTMKLLHLLDSAVGPGVMDKPMIPILQPAEAPGKITDPEVVQDLSAGKFDALFPGAAEKASDLYRASQVRLMVPSVWLESIGPLEPEVFVKPEYSPIAKAAHIEGAVSFTIDTDFDGRVKKITFESGAPVLQASVSKVSSEWKFPQNPSALQIHAVIEFFLNCPARAE